MKRTSRRVILTLLLTISAVFGIAADAPDPATRNARIRWVNEPKPGTLPTGVTHHTFFSKALNRDIGYCIYLPPGYETETAHDYHAESFSPRGEVTSGPRLSLRGRLRRLRQSIRYSSWIASSSLDSARDPEPVERASRLAMTGNFFVTFQTPSGFHGIKSLP